MRTANPALNSKVFGRSGGRAYGSDSTGKAEAPGSYSAIVDSTVMTVQGAVLKTGFLTLLLGAAAVYTWDMSYKYAAAGNTAAIMPWLWGGMLGGLVLALVTIFVPRVSPFTSPLYAIAEGLFLGAISAYFEMMHPDIAFQAVGLTFCTLFAMLLLYTTGVIRATPAFQRGLMAATLGIMLVYLMTFVLGFFDVNIPYVHAASVGGSGWIGIGFNLFVVVIAALNLVLDFDLIEEGAKRRAPKYMEWYAAFGLLVTLVWLYIEILRLLSRIRNR